MMKHRGIHNLVEILEAEDAWSKSLGVLYMRDTVFYTVTMKGLPNLIRAASDFVSIWLSRHSSASLQLNQSKRVLFELKALFGDHCILKWGVYRVFKHSNVSYVLNEHSSIAYIIRLHASTQICSNYLELWLHGSARGISVSNDLNRSGIFLSSDHT